MKTLFRVLVLIGHCPSKKNLWKTRKGGGRFIDSETQSQIQALCWQAKEQWGGKESLIHPELTVAFYVRNAKPDRDNKLTTLLDVLREAGVIKNDNIAQFNGELRLMPAKIAVEEKVEVTIQA